MQSDLGSFDDDGYSGEMPGMRKGQIPSPIMSDTPSFEDDSCPWCLHPADEFREERGVVGCPNCDSRIPVDQDWYQNGKKVVI